MKGSRFDLRGNRRVKKNAVFTVVFRQSFGEALRHGTVLIERKKIVQIARTVSFDARFDMIEPLEAWYS